jgi:hypothetical protein
MCRLIGGTEGRTGVAAISHRLSTTNRVENRRNAGGVADNQGCSSVEDRCCASYYRFSVHRNASESRLPCSLMKGRISSCNKSMLLGYCKPQRSKEYR